MSADGWILLVRHGPGRGRLPRYLQPVLDAIRADDAAFGRQVRDHFTGRPPPALDGCRAVVFWLADPLREWYPDCYREADAIAADARDRRLRIVNPPAALSNTIKSVQTGLWHEAGIPTVSQMRFESRAEFEALLPRVPFPAIVRGDETHAQGGLRIVADAAAARRVEPALPGVFAPLLDVREEWRRAAPRSVWARFHHKKRVFVLGDIVYANHVFFSDDPIVSMPGSTFRYLRRRWRHRGAYLRSLRWHRAWIAEDYEFSRRAAEHAALMRRATRTLGLDCVAIDYTSRPDGTVVLWEANPYFALTPWQDLMLARRRRLGERHARMYLEGFGRFFRSLLA